MEPLRTVVAVADSPAIRETLSVLLEHECQLQFRGADHFGPSLEEGADLALLALRHPENLVDSLRRRWPALPVVAVLPGAPHPISAPGVISVPLEPLAIRTAVQEALRDDADSPLRRSVRLITRTLQMELAYAFAALRTVAPQDPATVGRESYAVFSAIIAEQLSVIVTAMEQLEHFKGHARAATSGSRFALALTSALAQPDTAARTRGLLCQVATDTAAAHAAGPIGLAPLIAELLRWHLRRRSTSPVASVRHTANGITLRYRPRQSPSSPGGSWPLLLAALLLQRWSWRASTLHDGEDETVAICHP